MAKNLTLAAYWGPRRETIDRCAARASDFFQGIKTLDVDFEKWFHRGENRREALARPAEVDYESMRRVLSHGRHKRHDDGSGIDDLGYRLGLWNGKPGAESSAIDGTSG